MSVVGESVITSAGLEALASAHAAGASVQPRTYSISSRDYDLAESLELAALEDVWRTNDIDGYMLVDGSSAQFLVDVPPDLATAYCRTVALYLADGTLFMLAKPPYAIPPAFHQILQIQLVHGGMEALMDFTYLAFDETEQSLTVLRTGAVLGIQILENSKRIGLLTDLQLRGA